MIQFNRFSSFLLISISILMINHTQAETQIEPTTAQSTCSDIRGPYAIDQAQCTSAINKLKDAINPDDLSKIIVTKLLMPDAKCGNCHVTLKARNGDVIITTVDGAQQALKQIFQDCTGGYGQMKIPFQTQIIQGETEVDLIIDQTSAETCKQVAQPHGL